MIDGMFLKQKPAHALAALLDTGRVWYPALLAKETDCTYPHMVNTLAAFKENGLVSTEATGRLKIVRLTSDGAEVAASLNRAIRKMDRVDRKLKRLGKTQKV